MAKKKIVLIQTPIGDGSKVISERKDIPFGIAYVAKSLLKAGYEVEILDIYGALFYANSQYLDKNNVIDAIKKLETDYIGISALFTQYSYVKWLVSEIRKHRKEKIILGGKLPTYSPRSFLKTLMLMCVWSARVS